ncbi:MAG: DUF2249 domain-containing protein [Streptosporangiaceae bacterium]
MTALTRVLARALRLLGEAGRPDEASRLAADAWALLRRDYPGADERLTGLLHYLARLPTPLPPTGQPGPQTNEEETQMPTDQVLDVRAEPPARRHQLIFDTYAGLGAGDGFVLVNDHDPKPLYYQFAAEQAGRFTWDYLEGPETWRVRIGRAADRAGET